MTQLTKIVFEFKPAVNWDGEKFRHMSGHHIRLSEQMRLAAEEVLLDNDIEKPDGVWNDDILVVKAIGEPVARCGPAGSEKVHLEYLLVVYA